MHGELAQLVALAAHGVAYLSGPKASSAAPELYPNATVFRFTNAVTFRRAGRRYGVLPSQIVVGHCVAPWYADLRRRGAVSLRLARGDSVLRNRELAPYVEAGFSGGLDAGVVAHFVEGEREIWFGNWAVTLPEHSEQRIWRAEFLGVQTGARVDEGPPLAAARRRLDAALQGAIALVAGRMHFARWEGVFRAARGQLDTEAPEVRYYHDLLPSAGYELGARQLLAAASCSWVFGGMGSWNDVALDSEPAYELVTAELHTAVIDAVLAATNSFDGRDQAAAI